MFSPKQAKQWVWWSQSSSNQPFDYLFFHHCGNCSTDQVFDYFSFDQPTDR